MVDVVKRNGKRALVEPIHMLHGVCMHSLAAVRVVHALRVTIFSLNLATGGMESDAAGQRAECKAFCKNEEGTAASRRLPLRHWTD